MKPWYRVVVALLPALTLSCARAPVASDPQPAATEKPTTPPAVVKVKEETKEILERLPPPAQDENPVVLTNKEVGVLRGIVRWEGPEPLHASPRLRIDRATHGVADTVIRLRPLGKTKITLPPSKPVGLVVDRGAYRPHIVLAQKGSTLELRSIEDRVDFQASGAAAFSETIRRGESRSFRLSSPGLIQVRSQLQPDRAPAYIWVLDGTPGALTGTDGQFRLAVPPGEYELMLWHEDWHADEPVPPRTLRVRIALGEGEGAEVRWTLAEQR